MALPQTSQGAVLVSLLGGLRVAASGGVLDDRAVGRRAQVAFARLVVDGGEPVAREVLADAVWGELLPATWRPALRNVIADLRRGLVATRLDQHVSVVSSEGAYRVSLPPDACVDMLMLRAEAQEAERAGLAGDHRRASQLASVSGVSRVPLPGGSEEWVEALRLEVEELRERLARVAGEAALALGDAARAEQLGRGLIERSPLREDGHRLVIRALRASGNRAQALAAYDACRRLLAEELGALPSPQTQELFLEILGEEREEESLGPGPGRQVVTSRRLLRFRQGSPFVGRAELLDQLDRRLGLVESAGMFVACLFGEAGVGKTRLAAEFAGRVEGEGVGVLYGRADDRVAVPYAALLDALDEAALEPSGAANAQVGKQSIAAAMRVVSTRGPALVVLDDMHWASRAEIEVLGALLEQPDEVPLLVLLLHRSRDDAAIASLGAGPRIERLAVEPLDVADVRQLLAATRPDGRGGDDATRLWRLSGGNPLLASELLRSSWPEQPVAVDQLVRRRLSALPAGVEKVLRVAAVAGLEFDPDQVVAACPAPGELVRERLTVAESDGLIGAISQSERLFEFRHGLVRDALLDSFDPAERLEVHARLGSALEHGSVSDPAGRVSLAYHFAAAGPAGDWRRALRYAQPAAASAFTAGVYEDAVALATRTIATLEQAGDPDPSARLDLQVLLGAAQRAIGDEHAEQTLTRAFEEATTRGDPARMADAALAFSHTGSLSEEMYIDDQLLSVYERALGAQPDKELRRRALLLSRIASAQAWRQGTAESLRTGEQAVSLAHAHGEPQTLAAVLTATRRSMAGSHELEERERHEDELFDLADRLDDPGLRVNAALWRYGTSVLQGRGEHLEELLRAAGENARGLRTGSHHHSVAYEHASLALLRGRVAEADMLVERAVRIAREQRVASVPTEAVRLAQLLLVRYEQGRLAELRDEAAAMFEPSGIAAWLGVVAYIDASIGRLAGVAERLDAMLDEYAAHGPSTICTPGLLAFMAAAVVRLGDAPRASRLRELAAPNGGQGCYFAVFAGPIDYHLALLDWFLGDEQAARRRFAAAAEFCARLGAPSWEARCRGALHSGEGDGVA